MEITVTGRHTYAVPAESGLLTLSLGGEAATRREATATASQLASEVADALARLTEAGVVTWHVVAPLTTSSWRPQGNSGKPLPPRHGAQVRVQARFVDVSALATFVADWGLRDGCTLEGVAWELSDATRDRLSDDALTAAVEDAEHRALVVARAAGARDIAPVWFRDPQLAGPHPYGEAMFARAALADGGASPVVPEDVTGTVSIEGCFRTVERGGGATNPAPRRLHP